MRAQLQREDRSVCQTIEKLIDGLHGAFLAERLERAGDGRRGADLLGCITAVTPFELADELPVFLVEPKEGALGVGRPGERLIEDEQHGHRELGFHAGFPVRASDHQLRAATAGAMTDDVLARVQPREPVVLDAILQVEQAQIERVRQTSRARNAGRRRPVAALQWTKRRFSHDHNKLSCDYCRVGVGIGKNAIRFSRFCQYS